MTYKQIGAEFEVSENAIRNRIIEYEKKQVKKLGELEHHLKIKIFQ